jgi:hypothetical protein
MSKTYIIEVHRTAARSVAAGLVIQERGGFRFFAADEVFFSLDGCLFRSPSEAQKVATRIGSTNAGFAGTGLPGHGAPTAAQPQQTHSPRFEGDRHVEH